jgi:hypothetical protein
VREAKTKWKTLMMLRDKAKNMRILSKEMQEINGINFSKTSRFKSETKDLA